MTQAFLNTLADTANVSKAAAAINVARSSVYLWKEQDADFAKEWERALEIGVAALEDEAHRRAFDGCEEPVYYLGQKIDTLKRYSDTLAIFLLKAHRPERYRERFEGQITGDMVVNLTFGGRSAAS